MTPRRVTPTTMTDPTEPLAVASGDTVVRGGSQDADAAHPTLVSPPPTTWVGGRLGRRRGWRRVVLSARVEILGWVVLLLVFAGASALLVQRRVLHDRLDEQIEADLEREVDEVRRLVGGRDPETGELFAGDAAAILNTFLRRNIPDEGEVLLALVEGRPPTATAAPYPLWEVPGVIEGWSALTRSERGEISTPAGPVRYVAVPLVAGGDVPAVFVAAFFLDEARGDVESYIRVSAVVYGTVIIVAVALAWLVAGRVLGPVRSVTEAAKELSETDLSRRIEVGGGDDEIAELARTFNAMLDRLEAAFHNQRRFLDDAGHELRTPITIIRGHIELEGDDPEERRATRAVVLDELDRMARTVEDLLVLAQAGRPDFLRAEPVDLDLLTAELFAKCRALADRDWRLAGTGLGVVVADRQRLTEAVMNLADNAVRHTARGEVIELGSSLGNGEAAIWVRDSGPGVPLDQQDRIFERFARGRDGGRRPGTAGLGLAIVRSIALAHGGRVALESPPGAGATFTITIPAGNDVDHIAEDGARRAGPPKKAMS